MSADLAILRPKDPSRGSGIALLDVVNRGRKTVFTSFNRAAATGNLSTEAEIGDGFLLNRALHARLGGMGIRRGAARRPRCARPFPAPSEPRASCGRPSRRTRLMPTFTVGDLSGYTPGDPAAAAQQL